MKLSKMIPSHSKESTLQSRIKKTLKVDGWLVYKMPPLVTGFPDLMALRDGRAIFLEIKRDSGGRVGFFQAKMIQLLRSKGFTAEIIRSIEDFRSFYDKIERGTSKPL